MAVGGTTVIVTTSKLQQDALALRTLRLVCEAADERKAHDISVLDVRGQTVIADFFVICTGTSSTQIKAIAESVMDKLREVARLRSRPEGHADSAWLILDYSDVILHVFNEETREFYDLERLWADAKLSRYPGEALPALLQTPAPVQAPVAESPAA